MININETINIQEEISFFKDDYSFVFYCKEEVEKILNKTTQNNLDYMKFFIFLHLVLEISISQLFRQFVLGHIYLKTADKGLQIEDMDEKCIQDKFTTLSYFLDMNNLNKLTRWFNVFAEKRNKILHGHAIGEIWSNKTNTTTKIKDWLNDVELLNHLKLYNKIIDLLRDSVDTLPAFTASGKNDMKNILYSF